MGSTHTGDLQIDTAHKLTLSVPDAARRLGVGRNTLYDAIKRGEVPSIRVGRRLVVPIAALERLLGGAGV